MAKENSFSLRTLLEKEKLKPDGTNFTDWFRALTIVLRREKREYALHTPVPAQPAIGCTAEELTKYNKHKEDELDVQSLLVGIMGPELQRRFMDTKTYDMCEQLKNMFQEQARVEKFKVTRSLLSHKMTEGGSIGSHMLRMTSDVEQLEKLNSPLSKEFATDIILNSLPPSYSNFIMNYHMLGMDKSLQELQGMLRIAEVDMKKSSSVLMVLEGVRRTKKMKRKATPKVAPKYKGKGKMVPNQNTSKAKASTSDCFYCQGKGHWKMNCPKYLEDVKTRKVPKASTSSIFMIEVNVVTSIYDWVLDTGSCAHICSNIQALNNRRKLRNKYNSELETEHKFQP
jgi:gag-polypeptide of LTR copia-type